mmetsp:Transcript_53499/g.170188  ORF Transcript_53499/g.170188 Transcript_53499/m.170188 type:complete len:262 (+) Transcript_53499:308-1093(+)
MMMTSALRTTQFSGCALAPKPATAARRAPVPATVAQAVESNDGPVTMPRRSAVALAAAAAAGIALTPERAQAVQGLEAGRIPGIKPIGNGLYQYKRPEGKSGGHGVGWSEIPPYSFTIPDGWKEVPVSIADLGGTEIDLRFKSAEEGELSVVVAPVLRFADVGYGADVRIEDLGKPEQIIAAFGPELTGNVIDPDDVTSTTTTQHDGLTYYVYDVKPHLRVAATAEKNRLFIICCNASSLQFRKSKETLGSIRDTFRVARV